MIYSINAGRAYRITVMAGCKDVFRPDGDYLVAWVDGKECLLESGEIVARNESGIPWMV